MVVGRTPSVTEIVISVPLRWTVRPRLVAAAGPDLGVLVNNVGFVRPRPDGFESVTDEQWRQTLELDLLAHVRAMRAALPVLVARGGGAIDSAHTSPRM